MAALGKDNQLLLALSILLTYGAHLAYGSGCLDSSTLMFGAPWQPSFTVSEQETQYQQRGDVSRVTVYLNQVSGCLEGLTASYGFASSIAATIGIDLETAADDTVLVAQEINLSPGEVIDGVEYKVGNCIEYLKFTTSNGNMLEVGNFDSPSSLQSSKPAPGSFLGFFKGTVNPAITVTEESNTALPLQQLQLVWVKKDCSSATDDDLMVPANAGVDPSAANRLRMTRSQQKPQQTTRGKTASDGQAHLRVAQTAAPVVPDAVVQEAPMPSAGPTFGDDAATLVTGTTGATPKSGSTQQRQKSTAPTAAAGGAGSCAPQGCEDGVCATSSCTLNGLGKEAAAMLCFGTNLVPNMMKDQVPANPCSNLACKLTKSNCTSTGLLGIGGFCTGRVIAMGATAELHETGKKLVGYPCIEHRGLISEMVSKFGDYSAKGTYVAKAWKVCDCSPVPSQSSSTVQFKEAPGKGHENEVTKVLITTPSLSLAMANLSGILAQQQMPRMPDLDVDLSDLMQMLQKPVINMTIPDVTVQWMSAFASRLTVPSFNVSAAKLDALQALLPGFSAPAFIVPNISAPLLQVPITFDIPAFIIPEKTFPLVALLLPDIMNTSLPSLVLPDKIPKGVNLPAVLDIRNISTPNFYGMMERFILRLPEYEFKVTIPQLPSFKPAFEVPDVISQWISGFISNSPVPKIQVTNETMAQLRTLLPKFPQLPAMVSFEVAVPWLSAESATDIATFIIPNNHLAQVKDLLPDLGSLPTILVPQNMAVKTPMLTVPNITLPSFRNHVTRIMDMIPAVSSLAAGNTTVQPFALLDHLSDAAGSIGMAVQQAFSKQLGGLATTMSDTTTSRPVPEELPVDTSDDDEEMDDGITTAQGQPLVQEASV